VVTSRAIMRSATRLLSDVKANRFGMDAQSGDQ
jgi:hypothetical protein